MGIIKNPSLEQTMALVRRSKHMHLRGIATPTDLYLWLPEEGGHDQIIKKLGIDRQICLPLSVDDKMITPSIHLDETDWEDKSEDGIEEFMQNHASIIPLLNWIDAIG